VFPNFQFVCLNGRLLDHYHGYRASLTEMLLLVKQDYWHKVKNNPIYLPWLTTSQPLRQHFICISILKCPVKNALKFITLFSSYTSWVPAKLSEYDPFEERCLCFWNLIPFSSLPQF